MDDYQSVVNDEGNFKIISIGNKKAFMSNYVNNVSLRKEFKLIGTNCGDFKCDQILASVLLLRTSEFKKSIIVRTDDLEVLQHLDLVFDVGGQFDQTK